MNAKFNAWKAPIEAPVVMMSPPVSAWMYGTTASVIHCSYFVCSAARSSIGLSAADQLAPSWESTQYSLTRPASISAETASTIPLFAKSHARPCSDGNTSTGRP